LRVPSDLKAEMAAMAEAKGMDMSTLIRWLFLEQKAREGRRKPKE
jgi:antitoxin component of RelBE/YafQ-DinJ toxin-antitoxin module